MKKYCLSGPYKGYGAVPAVLRNGNGAIANGELLYFFLCWDLKWK